MVQSDEQREVHERAVQALPSFLTRIRDQFESLGELQQVGSAEPGWHVIGTHNYYTPQVFLSVGEIHGWAMFELHSEWHLTNSFRGRLVRLRREQMEDKAGVMIDWYESQPKAP